MTRKIFVEEAQYCPRVISVKEEEEKRSANSRNRTEHANGVDHEPHLGKSMPQASGPGNPSS